MSNPITIVGAHIKVYINNKVYKVTQNITMRVDYEEEPIFGIDSPWPQEIAGGRAMVTGSIKGVRIKYSGGLQADNLRPLFSDLAASPYVSIRVQDRTTSEDIFLIPTAKITNEVHTATAKGTYRLDFDFVGQIILFALDRVS